MKINIHAGHNPDGKVACGAVGLIKESTEARKVKDLVIKYLRSDGHVVHDCTVDDGTSVSNILNKIVTKCNKNTVDLDVSIHFNSGAKDKSGNGTTTGTEVLVYSKTSKANDKAVRICNKLSGIGFKNRGVKERNDLYFLKHTKAPALLIEVCFVDDKDDVTLYNKNVDNIAKTISEAIINKKINMKKVTRVTEKYKVIASALNIRKGAGTKYATTGQVYKTGTIVEVLKYNSGKTWALTQKGWVSMTHLRKVK